MMFNIKAKENGEIAFPYILYAACSLDIINLL